jgi:hypothetical protein
MANSRYHDRVLGYFDILGWSERVRASEKKNEILFDLFHVLTEIGNGWEDRTPTHLVQYTQFSDHVCVSIPAGKRKAINFVAASVHSIVEHLLGLGYPTRGAIVIGPLVHTGSIIFGPALLEAHEIESKVAKYPRILLSDGLLKAAESRYRPGKLPHRKDIDGMSFLDVFDTLSTIGRISRIRRALKQRSPERPTLDVQAKQNWLLENLRRRAAELRAA